MAKKQSKKPPSKEDSPGVKGKGGKADPKKDKQAAEVPKPNANVIKRPSSGKTPLSLLHEHAQKSKWERVQYDMFKVKDGFVATAILGWIDPKSKDVITVKVKHNLPPKETPIEARYYAATVALHKVCFNKNLHMVLPKEYKDIWAQLESDRKLLLKENTTKHNRTYVEDPFKLVLEDRKLQQNTKTEEEVRLNQESKLKKAPTVITSTKNAKPSVTKNGASITKPTGKKLNLPGSYKSVTFPKKVWDSATSFNLNIRDRELIQNAIRSHIQWEPTRSTPVFQRETLTSLGFRESHVDEAMKYQDPLSFLLFNVPDDDLPAYFVDTRSNDSITLAYKNENLLRRVTQFGISRSEAILALSDNNESLSSTIIQLTKDLISFKDNKETFEVDEQQSQEIWDEEVESLSMIFEPDSILHKASDSISFKFNDVLILTVFKPAFYPYQLAGFIISTVDTNLKLPNYIKLQLIARLASFAVENCLGDSYIFSLIDWLQQNSDHVIENPGPLISNESNRSINDIDLNIDTNSNKLERKFFRSKPDVQAIEKDYLERVKSDKYKKMCKQRISLPAWNEQESILQIVNSNNISLITGETGSGKSTQLVQFILDDLNTKGDFTTSILCTQPRRISAIGLAERVAEERATTCGEEVGYIIRGVNKSNKNTRIKFLTTGILVKFLQNSDEVLKNTILVIDEVHERSMETDLIIIMIKKLLKKFKNLKVILMSATVDLSVFKSYFVGLQSTHIKGRTFPIEDFFLDDVLEKTQFKLKINDELILPKPDSKFFQDGNINYDLISQLVIKIDQDLTEVGNSGSILIFLSGVAEITKCIKNIQQSFNKPSVILPLHSALTPQEQHRVFENFVKKRKIIVSTNIAETSITISDCVVTIDSGRAKSMTYNAIDNTTQLLESFISKAEAKQRRGRAGRVLNGTSYKLYTKETYEKMIDNPIPEIKRVNLDSLYLVVKSMGIANVVEFLDTGLDPPPKKALMKSEEILKCSGLINEFNELTELGKYVSLLPIIDPKHGKLLLYSIIFGCANFGILIASVLSSGTPFLRSQDFRDKVKELLSRTKDLGDLISTAVIVNNYFQLDSPKEKKKFIDDHYLSFTKLRDISSAKSQISSILKDLGFLSLKESSDDSFLNRNGSNFGVIKAVITGAFYPQVARVQLPDPKYFNTSSGSVQVDPDAKLIKYWIRNEEFVTKLYESSTDIISTDSLPATRSFIHPSSVLFDTSNKELQQTDIQELKDQSEREDGLVDFAALQKRKIDLTPTLRKAKNKAITSQFIVYNSSTVTNKLYLREITPSSSLSTLLFGGPISYDLTSFTSGKPSPGIVLDNWLPINTWCKNAVLIKELRVLLDSVIREQLENPAYSSEKSSHKTKDVLQLLDALFSGDL